MIKSKTKLISSMIILCICSYLYFPYPDNLLFEARSSFMNFPVTTQDGYDLLGAICALCFIVAILLIIFGMKKYRLTAVFLVVLGYSLIPLALITLYQETFASGVEAISYDRNGECDFEYVSEDLVNGECNLTLYNRSNEAVTFELEFLDPPLWEDEYRMDSLMNIEGPYTITIEPNHKKSIVLNESLDLSGIPKHTESGSSFNVHLKLIGDKTGRIL